MRVGIPTEIKNNEYRVAITPAGEKLNYPGEGDLQGRPLPGVRVLALNTADGLPAGHSISDAAGAFAIRYLPEGAYKLRARDTELENGKVFPSVPGEPVTDLRFTLPAAPRFQPP